MAEHLEGVVNGIMYHRHHHEKNYDYDRNRCYDDPLTELAVDGIQKLLHEVPETRNAIADKINAAMLQENMNSRAAEQMMCGMERNLVEGHRDIQRDVVENKFAIKDAQCELGKEIIQNRFEVAKTESKIVERLDYESDLIKMQMTNFERSVDKQFCEVKSDIKDSERRILDRLTADKIDEKNDLINELRHERRNCEALFAQKENQLAFSNQLNLLHSQMIELNQNQRATNTTYQFGAGNLAGQAATANQVR